MGHAAPAWALCAMPPTRPAISRPHSPPSIVGRIMARGRGGHRTASTAACLCGTLCPHSHSQPRVYPACRCARLLPTARIGPACHAAPPWYQDAYETSMRPSRNQATGQEHVDAAPLPAVAMASSLLGPFDNMKLLLLYTPRDRATAHHRFVGTRGGPWCNHRDSPHQAKPTLG